ncbi:hypothetical protein HC251_25225 (plasmid) [Iamia sp. SCSIO 61187]|uniref:hypothetical protein n=1 Tax=Iamia sp. SCSIO 61187 TaxID=2722752 RepID=UPI001C630955|nr:hypothetical protein [Iamia sp. SCSIO 61187]QYG95853.1 hypothetical protein HC251_25225 [Iamia sp. SCSIO 61187]
MEGLLVQVHLEDEAAYAVGDFLVDLDREMRRAETVIRTGSDKVPRRRAELLLVKATRSSSAELELLVYGGLEDVLLNAPLQFLITLDWLWQRRPKRWGSRRPAQTPDPEAALDFMAGTAQRALDRGQQVALTVRVDANGGYTMTLDSELPTEGDGPDHEVDDDSAGEPDEGDSEA